MVRTIAALSLLLFSAAHAAASDRERIVGVWEFVREVDTRADGSPAPAAAMSECEGLLIYTPNGFVSVTIMPKSRTWSTDTATLAELQETMSNGTSYAGRFELDPAAHTVTHITSVALEPDFQGKRLVRSYSLQGDRLVLSGTFPFHDETIHFALTWKRVR